MLIAIGAFVAIAGIVMAAYWFLIVRPEQQAQDSVRKRLDAIQPQSVQAEALVTDQRFSQLEILHKLLSNTQSFAQPLQSLIDQSGLSITVGTLVTGSAFGALLGFTLGGIVTHSIESKIVGPCL